MGSGVLAELDQLEQQARTELAAMHSADDIQALRVRFLGRKGLLTSILRDMSTVPREEKPKVGQRANQVKTFLEAEIARIQTELQSQTTATKLAGGVDVTLPGRRMAETGHVHPISLMMAEIERIFADLGFSIFTGPEVETDWYNFDALNIPADHPARDMQDTLYVGGAEQPQPLRTHTSPVQVRVMQTHQPPIRMIAPGAAFRRDDVDMTHSPMFHQIEGLVVDTHITMSHLKGTLLLFIQQLFGANVHVRFRPSFFPFVEPGAEVDVGYVRDGGTFRVAREGEDEVTDWLEILGSGMVNPAVFEAVGLDPMHVSGFAFGMGVERLAMLKWGIDDIRHFFENDLRFLEQF